MSPELRFQTKYTLNEWGCFVWHGEANQRGRCRFAVDGKKPVAYRWAWEQQNGPVPEGKELDHFRYPETCIGGMCANPEHVRPVSRWENTLRSEAVSSRNLAKTHCPQNHEYTEENTLWATNGGKNPGRRCRTCVREDSQRRRELKKNGNS